MKRKNREINIFSMSALDLFASAMGAFILIAVVAIPYYLKTDKQLMNQNKQLEELVQKTEEKLNQCELEKLALNTKISQLEKELEDSIKFAILGITTKSKSFTIVIDMSGSMDEYTDIMERTVGQIIEPLDDSFRVQILGYNGNIGVTSWQKPYSTLDMNKSNKNLAQKYVSDLSKRFEGTTPTEAALVEALKYDTESIILLTDGSPDGKASQIVSNITRLNGGRKEIHSVALGDYDAKQALVKFLQELSKQNKGGFIGVAN